MGDAETDLLAKRLITKVDVLKDGHHGSKYSTSAKFLEKALLTYSVLSVGKNGYNYPTFEVSNCLEKVRSTAYRTDKSGNIISNSNKMKVTPRVVR